MSQSIKKQLESRGIAPKKSLGQNFCTDERVSQAMAHWVTRDPPGEIWEIGPGTGALTRRLLDIPVPIRLFEIDQRLKPILENLVQGKKQVSLYWGDFFDAALPAMLPPSGLVICGNLPYYCGTGMVRNILDFFPPVAKGVFLLQMELVDKMAAGAGDDEYGFLSVAVQLFSQVFKRETFPPTSFFPNPKVQSSIVEVVPLKLDDAERERRIAAQKLAGVLFNQRRKMALPLLKKLQPQASPPWPERFEKAGLDPTIRPERIPPETFIKLAGKA